ncbi:MAG: type VI secretion system TssO [Chitinophagaceae bacterium]
MQQVLNSQERNQAFLKFLLFFLVTIALVILAIFFNYKMPARENAMLQEEVEDQRAEEANQQKFVTRMEAAVSLLDSLEKKNVNFDQINMQLNSKITDMLAYQQKDNSLYGKFNKVVLDKLGELQQNKKLIHELSGNDAKITTLQAEVDKCKNENMQLNVRIDNLSKQPGGF